MPLTDQDREFIRGAEQRIHDMAAADGTEISPLVSTAIKVELERMFSIGKTSRNIEIAEQVLLPRFD